MCCHGAEAPRLASAGKILGTLIIIATAVNLKLDLLEKPGFSLEEYITISIAFVLFLIAFFASKERKTKTYAFEPSTLNLNTLSKNIFSNN